MAVTKPDATVFDNADDSIATSRAELHTLATSFNTIADDYNAGLLTQSGNDLQAGTNIEIKAYDSAGANNIIAYGPEHNTYVGSFFSSSGNVTAQLPSHFAFRALNTTGTLNTINMSIPAGNITWDRTSPVQDRAPGPDGNRSYVGFLNILAPSDNDANVDIQLYVNTTTGTQNLGSAYTFTPGDRKLFRVTVMQDIMEQDSAGVQSATVVIEDLTSSATTVLVSSV